MRGVLRRVLTWILGVAFVAIILAVVAEGVIEVLRDKGLYDNAGKRWDSLVSAVLAFVASPLPLAGISALAGLVGGLWLDQLLLKQERGAPARAFPARDDQKMLDMAVNEAFTTLGTAMGDGSLLTYQLAI